MLGEHRLKILPVLDEARQLVGIVSVGDLLDSAMAARRFSWRALFGRRRPVRLEQVMTKPVRSVNSDEPAVALIPLLCDQGLHCLPVLEAGQLVGVVTQTDLIGALHQQLLQREQAGLDQRVPALGPVTVPRDHAA